MSIKVLPFGHISLELRGGEIKPEEKQKDKYPVYIIPKKINDLSFEIPLNNIEYSRQYIL